MKLLYHPDYTEEIRASSIGKFLDKDLARHPLKDNVDIFLRKIMSLPTIEEQMKRGYIKPLPNKLFEMRIPPLRHGGVVRIYFCFAIDDPQTLIILDAELKHDRAAQKIERAHARYIEYCVRSTKNEKNKRLN